MKVRSIVLAIFSGIWVPFAPSQGIVFPVVTVHASDPVATEAGPTPGSFLVERRGATNTSLAVFYALGGTASNGVDYATLATSVVIPPGAFTASIPVKPIDD